MIPLEQFQDWRGSDITQEFLKAVTQQVSDAVGVIVNRRQPDAMDDQYLRGAIAALSAAVAWRPELVDTRTGETIDGLSGEVDDEA